MEFFKRFFIAFCCVLLLASCGGTNSINDEDNPDGLNPKGGSENSDNPEPFSTKNENLDLLFGLDEEAELTVNISRDEWNKMLMYYSWWESNEEYVQADCVMSKKGYTWKVPSIGLRIRGNTSRACPQDVDFDKKTGFGPGNNNYVQAHFKISFEEYLTGDDEYKMAKCISGLMLKRFKSDPTYAREVYGYNFFRQSGIWDAPRAGYCHLTIKISEKDGSVESVDYGTYAMIEQIDKQFLKARTQKQLNSTTNGFVSNDGNLWKCSWGANLCEGETSIGCEKKSFNTVSWTDDIISTEDPGINENSTYRYDLKTNKKSLSDATTELNSFVSGLNSCSCEDDIKDWYESHMDVDLFLKTYACNVALGMWDDYWSNNGNNWYFYIDKDSSGSTGKAYFIPYDYDNILGVNWNEVDWANQNPLYWKSNDYNPPLVEKALQVEEFKTKYKNYLLEITGSGTWFDPEVAAEKITGWHTMIQDKIASTYLIYSPSSDVFDSFADYPDTGWGNPYKKYKIYTDTTDSALNYFVVRRNCIENYVENKKAVVTFYAADETTVLQTVSDVEQGTEISSLFTESEPTVSGGKFAYWTDSNGKQVESVSGFDVKLYPEFVYKTKLPVVVNEDGSVTVIFRPDDYDLSGCWMNVQWKSKSKTKSEIAKVSLRGNVAFTSCGWNTYDQLDLTENEDGTYSYTFEKDKYCYEDATDPDGCTCFKFIITWNDESCSYTENETEWVKNEESGNYEEILKNHSYTNDYTWMNYSDKTYALPDNCKFRWDTDDADDYKYVLKNLVDLYNSIK